MASTPKPAKAAKAAKASKPARPARPARPAHKTSRAPAKAEAGNGMHHFAVHTDVPAAKTASRVLAARPAVRGARAVPAAGAAVAARGASAAPAAVAMDPESAAAEYLKRALKSSRMPEFTDPQGAADGSEFQRLGTESVPLTGSRVVKYRQTVHKIPIYGSLVTVELDHDNKCLAINSSLGAPKGLSAVAKVAPQAALELAAAQSGNKAAELKATPRLNYYFDKARQAWALAYIVENVPKRSRSAQAMGHAQAALFDYVVDAHSGKLIAALPRTASAAIVERAIDGLGMERSFTVERNSRVRTLLNRELNIATYAFRFGDPVAEAARLPGTAVKRTPPKSWPAAAVSAHANAEIVGRFLRDVVLRDGIDNAGGKMVSTVDCVVAEESEQPREWLNAYWDPELRQMVYGQRVRGGGKAPFSIAAMLDIVGHEMFHGVTDGTARLEYAGQSGAMNESYSDIFGVLIQNADVADRSRWQWQVGIGFSAEGEALRDLQDPTRRDQPAHMDEYLRTGRPSERNDWGGVHTNSGVHNHAAYKMMVARSAGQPVFSHRDLSALFYLALTQHLTRTSEFADSRRALLLVAPSLFRADPPAVLRRKTAAIRRAFSAVGIY